LEKNSTLFLTSQTISLFGSMLVQYAITWYITLKTQSGTMMTISIVCGFLPTFFLSPFAGVWADRYHRKMLIILSDTLIAAATLILAVLFFMGFEDVWLLFVASAIRALGTGIQTPAVGAFLPQLAPEDKLTKINAINGSIQSLVTLVSPLLSGALLTMATIEIIFLIDVVTAAIAVMILLLGLHIPAHQRALNKQTIGYFGDLRQGAAYIKQHEFVKVSFSFIAIYFILVAPVAFLTPLLVTRSFGEDVWRLTATSVCYSAGMIAGGVIVAAWRGFKNKAHSMVLSIFLIGASTFALGITSVFWPYLFLMGLIGVAMPFFNTPFIVLLQQKVEGGFLGRVFGVLSMISSSIMPLGMLVYGPVADIIKIEWLLVGTGLLMLVQSLAMLSNKVLLEAGKPIAKSEP
jgi:DHA3 family macrolide efflux protein-like MFS transporter